MDNTSNNKPATSIDQEFAQIGQLARQAYDLQLKNRSFISNEVAEGLQAISTTLMRLSNQANRWKEEQGNLVALTEVSQVVNSSLEIDEVLRIVMDTIIRLTGAERGFLMLKDETGQFVTRTARNWEQESIGSSEFAISRSVVDRVVSTGQAVLTTNASEDPRFGDKESIIIHNMRSIMCAPLKVKGELTGVVYTDNRFRSGIFSDSKLKLLATFADQAAIAIENARLFESVRRSLAEVTELKNLMDNVFASIASGVITTDLSEQITLCNHAAQHILGNIHREMAGAHLQDLLPSIKDSNSADFYEQLSQVIQQGQQIVGLEITPTLPERGEVVLSLNLSPLRDASHIPQGVAIVLDDLTEKKRLEAQRRLFERMVSPAVIEQLNPDQLQLGGKRSQITVLFADIRGFTSFSEKLDPVQLVTILNQYLAAAADAVLAQEGTIDKFLGDAVMAWYNAPIPQPDHAARAVLTALAIRSEIEKLQARLPDESRLSFGVGIHFGEAVLGLVGTEKRLEYTAIGDCVNTAKRIQENSLPGQILISAEVYQLVAELVQAHPVAPVNAKGKSQPIEVYEVLGLR
ncbi:MAG: GAF domain-containing protein [Anaerolineales bacterium]|nr:GAF domain-containing protein [Anaerolineales bacterium]